MINGCITFIISTRMKTVKAIGITRALIWKRNVPHLLADIIKEAGGPDDIKPSPSWVMNLFADDKTIINKTFNFNNEAERP